MKTYIEQVAEAVRDAVLDQVGDYYLDTCPSSQVRSHVSIDIPAIIASVESPEPVAWRQLTDVQWMNIVNHESRCCWLITIDRLWKLSLTRLLAS